MTSRDGPRDPPPAREVPATDASHHAFLRLRKRAEKLLRERPASASSADLDLLETIHELEVHQTELAIQNAELQRSEGELADLHREYADLYEQAPCGYLTCDARGLIVRANRAVCELLAADRSRLVGTGLSRFLAEGSDASYREILAEAGRTGERRGTDLELRTVDAEPRWARMDVRAIRNSDGEVERWQISFVDGTERRRIEEERRRSEAMRVVGQFAGGIAHDFNNQLAGILGLAELIGLNSSDSCVQRLSREIIESSEHAAQLAGQVLAFARGGTVPERRVPVEVEPILRKIELFLGRAAIPPIRIRCEGANRSLFVLGDAAELEAAILNLAINARNAMPEGGVLHLKLAATELESDFCERAPFSVTPGTFVRITVEDTGQGMDETTRERMFEPYFTTRSEGAGLGLAAVYGTVERHRGTYAVESEIGRGTRIDLFLPLAPDEPPAEAPSVADAPARVPARILLADDEEVVREMTRAILEHDGHRVVAVGDGRRAVEYFGDHRNEIDLVILDLVMPVLGGRAAFEALRRIDPAVRAFFISGYDSETDGCPADEPDPVPLLSKPFRRSALAAMVARVLGHRSELLASGANPRETDTE